MIVEATDVSGPGDLSNRERRLVYVNTDHVAWVGKRKIYRDCPTYPCPAKNHGHGHDLVTSVLIEGTFFDFLEEREHFLGFEEKDLDSPALLRRSPLRMTPR